MPPILTVEELDDWRAGQHMAGLPVTLNEYSRTHGLDVRIPWPTEDIQEWRANQSAASLPSALGDFWKAFGVCPACQGSGWQQRVKAWTLVVWLCESCHGTGEYIGERPALAPANMTKPMGKPFKPTAEPAKPRDSDWDWLDL